jgi:hypothetical protein
MPPAMTSTWPLGPRSVALSLMFTGANLPQARLWYNLFLMSQKRRSKRIFSYDEALATFPVVRDLTTAAVRRIESLTTTVGSLEEMDDRREEIEDEYQKIVSFWAKQVSSIGCEVKGLWLVDWDSGDGYYCWRFPEQAIGFFHTYEEGFAERLPIN